MARWAQMRRWDLFASLMLEVHRAQGNKRARLRDFHPELRESAKEQTIDFDRFCRLMLAHWRAR